MYLQLFIMKQKQCKHLLLLCACVLRTEFPVNRNVDMRILFVDVHVFHSFIH